MSELCQELCGYHVDVAVVLQDVRYLTCLQHFDTFIECGAGKVNTGMGMSLQLQLCALANSFFRNLYVPVSS